MPKIIKTVTRSSITHKSKLSSVIDLISLPRKSSITEELIKRTKCSQLLQA